MVVVAAVVVMLGSPVGEYISSHLSILNDLSYSYISNNDLTNRLYRQQPKEPFQKTERRDWAETVLDNPELLLMYAQSSGDVSTHFPFNSLHLPSILC